MTTTRTWSPLLAGYHTHQKATAHSAGTIRLYRYRLLVLADLHPDPTTITTAHLEALIATDGWKPETRKGTRTTVRSFFRWAHKAGHLPTDPAADLAPVRVPQAEPRPAPEKVLRAAMREASPRERLMVMLGAYAGLRCCEIAPVHGSAWDGERLAVLGKGGKLRRVPIAQPDLVDALDALEGYAFPNRWTGEPITPGHVSRLLSAALRETWTGHTLRHRYGTRTLEVTKDLLAVGKVLGHASTETTKRYCAVDADRLLAVAQAAA